MILFLHGVLVNGDLWRGVVPALATNHRCITPDLPLGAHTTPMRASADITPPGLVTLIAEFIAALDLTDVTVVASDVASAAMQMLVTSDPTRIGKLVLTPCDSFWGFPPRILKPGRWLGLLPAMMPIAIRAVSSGPLSRFMFWSSMKRRIDPAVMASYRPLRRSTLIRRDLGKFFRDVRPTYTRAVARKLPGFRRPTLIEWAADDLWLPVRKLAALIPNAQLEIVPNSRTLLAEDQPEALTRLISSFLHEPAPPTPRTAPGTRRPDGSQERTTSPDATT